MTLGCGVERDAAVEPPLGDREKKGAKTEEDEEGGDWDEKDCRKRRNLRTLCARTKHASAQCKRLMPEAHLVSFA